MTLLAFPLALAGLYYSLISSAGRRFRMLGWMYVVPLLLFIIAKGRSYYLAGAYPMLYAAGGVCGERWLASLRGSWRSVLRAMAWTALVADVAMTSAFTLPVARVNSAWWKRAVKVQGDFREELGWPELVQTVAGIRDALPAQDRTRLGILAGNYGEAGAINLYGPNHGLPQAISGINSFSQRGYGDPPPGTLIVLGISHGFLERNFQSCEVAGHTIRRRERRDQRSSRYLHVPQAPPELASSGRTSATTAKVAPALRRDTCNPAQKDIALL